MKVMLAEFALLNDVEKADQLAAFTTILTDPAAAAEREELGYGIEPLTVAAATKEALRWMLQAKAIQRYETQDPKYVIIGGRLHNATSGMPIPADEPIFLFRAKDNLTLPTMLDYHSHCVGQNEVSEEHIVAVTGRIQELAKFREAHPERMKFPDTK